MFQSGTALLIKVEVLSGKETTGIRTLSSPGGIFRPIFTGDPVKPGALLTGLCSKQHCLLLLQCLKQKMLENHGGISCGAIEG